MQSSTYIKGLPPPLLQFHTEKANEAFSKRRDKHSQCTSINWPEANWWFVRGVIPPWDCPCTLLPRTVNIPSQTVTLQQDHHNCLTCKCTKPQEQLQNLLPFKREYSVKKKRHEQEGMAQGNRPKWASKSKNMSAFTRSSAKRRLQPEEREAALESFHQTEKEIVCLF